MVLILNISALTYPLNQKAPQTIVLFFCFSPISNKAEKDSKLFISVLRKGMVSRKHKESNLETP